MIVNVKYHTESDGVWADSDDVPGLAVAGATSSEVRELVRDGLPFFLEVEEADIFVIETFVGDLGAEMVNFAAMPGVGLASRADLTFGGASAVDVTLDVSFTSASSGDRRVPTPA